MQSLFFSQKFARLSAPLMMATALALLAGCTDNTGKNTPISTTPIPAIITLGTDKNSIPTDNATAATLTATLLDSANATMPGISVSFSTNTGNLSASTVTTDPNGQAVVTLKSGTDPSNRTATVAATVVGINPATVPILITGSTVTLTTSSNSIQVGAGTLTANTIAKNAGGVGQSNQSVLFSTSSTNGGAASISVTAPPPVTVPAATCNATPVASCALTTDALGNTPALTFTPTAAGTVVLTAQWLDSTGAVTATATQNIVVTSAAGIAFAITTPATDPLALSIGVTQTLIATVPTQLPVTSVTTVTGSTSGTTLTVTNVSSGSLAVGQSITCATCLANTTITAFGAGTTGGIGTYVISLGQTNASQTITASTTTNITVTNVRISSTSGTWTGVTPATGPLASIMQVPTANAVAATYTAPANSGSVSVQVDALGTVGGVANTTLATLSRTFVISAPAAAAAKLFLSASVSTLVPSSGSNISTSTLQATVRDINNNAVGGAAVIFGLLATTGSGESVSPAVAITDSFGKATSVFSAGSSPTVAAIYAQGSVIGGAACTFVPDPLVAETTPTCDEAPLIVSSAAVSVTVGFGTKIVDAALSTQYQLPGSVLVVDANGSAVPGAIVTLTVFPIEYRNGVIQIVNALSQNGSTTVPQCGGPYTAAWDIKAIGATPPPITTYTASEDANRNGILDPGEDTGIVQTASQLGAEAISQNGRLSPPSAAGGAVPLTVTTDATGAATFYLQYPKSSAWFIRDEVSARVIVAGSESTAKTNVDLGMSTADQYDPHCALSNTGSY